MRFIEVGGEIYVEDEGEMLPLNKYWLSVWAAMGEVQLLKEVMARIDSHDTESTTPTDKVKE